ncbi:MAG: hypothetical protein A2156_09185 [Deltaproteobacteria bacterium RBG_16_48_10]|nr:MAG: hypothetical protein A2156_09185 [Deltaproteobacteria bacterium RBG_16_48_10]
MTFDHARLCRKDHSASPGSTWLRFERMPFLPRLKSLGFPGMFYELEIKRVTLSYLHLRPAIHQQLMRELPPLHQRLMESCFRTQDWKSIGTSSKSKLLPPSIREKGYQRIRGIAQGFGIASSICQCKNPDLEGDLCGSSRVRMASKKGKPTQLSLFQC